ncbi:MAG: histidine kinase [Bacteroidota bacterium]
MEKETKWIDWILNNRLLSHVLFWLALVGINTIWATLDSGNFRRNLIHTTALLPAQLLAAYFLIYYQLPELYRRKRYLLFGLSLAGSIVLLSALGRISIVYGAEPFTRKEFVQESITEIFTDVPYLLMVYFPAIYISALILWTAKTVKERYEVQNQLERLQKEKVMTELKFLKAQIHPHFLFNTLNNLYLLTLQKSDIAPEVVVKLSSILDYILYQCSDPMVPIEQEIKLLQNYIDLELLRYGDNIDLRFEKHIDDPTTPVAPLLLLSIVENAFKHGASKNLVDPLIHIELRTDSGQVYFKVHNSKAAIPAMAGLPALTRLTMPGMATAEKRQGVGSDNIARQLELIYPKRHQLQLHEDDKNYTVELTIKPKANHV